jgi:phosphate acetyltransferase
MKPFIETVFEKLRRHPKRIVFPEGDNPRVIQAAADFVTKGLGVAVLLGKRQEIAAAAAGLGASLKHILVINPEEAGDLPFFVKRLEQFPRYRGIREEDARKIVLAPNYFGTLMLQNGQVDGLVAGTSAFSGTILRPLFQLIKPLPGIKSISSAMIMEFEGRGVYFFADAGVIPNPTVEQLCDIAVETARLRRQLTGERPRVAMLSYSTKGSAQTKDAEKVVAATVLARQKFHEQAIEAEIDGELQVDAALLEEIARIKAPESLVAGRADVLVFPDLNSGNIATKLLQRLARGDAYGQILTGLSKPAAEVSRGASVEELVGVAAIVALQAIEYRKLYPADPSES